MPYGYQVPSTEPVPSLVYNRWRHGKMTTKSRVTTNHFVRARVRRRPGVEATRDSAAIGVRPWQQAATQINAAHHLRGVLGVPRTLWRAKPRGEILDKDEKQLIGLPHILFILSSILARRRSPPRRHILSSSSSSSLQNKYNRLPARNHNTRCQTSAHQSN